MKSFKRLKKTFRSFLVFVMVFLISGSSLNFAFATYGILVPDFGDNQKVNIEHIWVDSDNKGDTRPGSIQEEVTAKDGNGDPVDFAKKDTPDTLLENKKDVITDDGSTAGKEAGAAAGEQDKGNVVDGIVTPSQPNPGKDDGFKQGYDEGYQEAVGKDVEIQEPTEDPAGPSEEPGDEQNPEEPTEDPAGPSEEPGNEQNPEEPTEDPAGPSEEPGDEQNSEEPKRDESLSQLDPGIADAIEDILGAKDNSSLVIQNPTDEVDEEMKNKVEDVIQDQLDPSNGNTWHVSEDYVAKVEDTNGLHYEVELPQTTKDQLKNAGYESVQLKITYETVFAVKDDTGAVYIDPYTGKELEREDRVLAICQHVSYDGGKTWQSVGEPRFEKNGKPYTYIDDTTKEATILTWDKYVDELKYAEYNEETRKVELSNEEKTDEEKAEVAAVRNYDPTRDYVQETTYTFLHVLRDPEPETPTPEIPETPTTPTTPKTTPTQVLPEEPVPLEEPLVDVPPEDVPLTTVPRTDDISNMWTMLVLLSVTGLMGVTLLERKKANNS